MGIGRLTGLRGVPGPGQDRKSSSTIKALLLAVLLTGCATGPDFKRPVTGEEMSYTANPVPAQTASAPALLGETQVFSTGAIVEVQWWHALGCTRLDGLVEQALQTSPTLASARATLRKAQEVQAAQAGLARYPQASLDYSAQYLRTNPSGQGLTGDSHEFDVYRAGVGVQYRLDLAGSNRRTLEALAARTGFWQYELEGERLTLVANMVYAAITQARLDGQIRTTQAIVQNQEEQLHLAQERVRIGHAARTEVLALQTQVEQTRAGGLLLLQQFQQSQHLLAVLGGRAPGAGELPVFVLEEFTLPTDLPLVLPSELVRSRPDIQAAEALLHAATAEYGVAVARMYPQLNLSAGLASQALSSDALFGSGSAVWSLLGQLTQPLFNPGLSAEKRASLAALDAAAANYQAVVLASLRNVADILLALENDALRLAALASAHAAAQESVESMNRQYALGAVSQVQLLMAHHQAYRTQFDLSAAQAQRLLDSAALFQAMGGGGSYGDTYNP